MKIKGSKIAVVGGAGFIGSHLVDKLVEMGGKVVVLDNLFLGKKENVNPKALFYYMDASNDRSLSSCLLSIMPDLIYNLAVLPLPHSLVEPHENIAKNIQIVQNLCGFCNVPRGTPTSTIKLIHFSSSEVYGSAQYEPMCENHPIGASTPYAAAKAACDFICMSYVKTFGCNISILRPFNNYGPRQNAGSYAGVIPLTINRLMNGENPIIYGDGLQTRDYIYVEDTVRAAILLAGSDLQGEIINVGSGHDVSIKWLVSEIMKLVGWEKTREIEIQPARPGDVRRHIANVLKAKDLLGFQHKVGMEEGLKKTVAWYLSKSGIYQEGREWIDIIFRLF